MTSRISHPSTGSRDAYAQPQWWSAALDMAEDPDDLNEPGHEECMIVTADRPGRPLILDLPEAKQVKNQLHLDLRPTDHARKQEGAWLVALGAREVADHRRADGSGWSTLADLEGNKFCVLSDDGESSCPAAHQVELAV